MGKKSKRNRPSSSSGKQPQSIPQDEDGPRVHPSLRTPEEETIDNLRFQDPFVEEYEVDDDEWEDDDGDDEVAMKPKSSSTEIREGDENKSREMEEIVQAWNPFSGEPLQPGEQLEMDASAYKMYHALQHEWPALSFDFVRDDYGEARIRFPHTLTAALGTQADTPANNSLTVMKISDLSKVHVETDDDILGEELETENDEEDSDDDDDDDEEMDPVMEHYSIPHRGGVNRVRVMPQRPDVVATWSDTGHVHLFNIAPLRQRFQPKTGLKGSLPVQDPIPTKPFFSYANVDRGVEGFALDWSPVIEGQLATGDCHGSIHVWQPRPESGHAVSHLLNQSQQNRSAPVLGAEDIQWSPTEGTVLAAAFGGGTVRVFDTRKPGQAMIGHTIHKNSDVNVLSWNRLVTNLLATGGDDGTLAVWDLRQFSSQKVPPPLARFTPHKSPITSVEWHPTDESMLVASDDVGTYIYDLSVEEDDVGGSSGEGVPPQLLFVHCGSEQFKEVHWHPQISSCVMTTALTGLSVFIPSNL
jgi:ribosome assembly protein RRB1